MKKQKISKTRWHRLLGRMLEELLSPVGIGVYTEFPVMSEPPKADILLLKREDPMRTPSSRRVCLTAYGTAEQIISFWNSNIPNPSAWPHFVRQWDTISFISSQKVCPTGRCRLF